MKLDERHWFWLIALLIVASCTAITNGQKSARMTAEYEVCFTHSTDPIKECN